MECQILVSGKHKKYISKCRLLKLLPSILSVNNIIRNGNIGWFTNGESLIHMNEKPCKLKPFQWKSRGYN